MRTRKGYEFFSSSKFLNPLQNFVYEAVGDSDASPRKVEWKRALTLGQTARHTTDKMGEIALSISFAR